MRTSALSINADGRMPAMRTRNRLMSNEMAALAAVFVSRNTRSWI